VLQVSLRLEERRFFFFFFILDTENICELFIAAAALVGNPINQRRSVEECEVKEFYIFFVNTKSSKCEVMQTDCSYTVVLYSLEQGY
jgi:hypothetical protein